MTDRFVLIVIFFSVVINLLTLSVNLNRTNDFAVAKPDTYDRSARIEQERKIVDCGEWTEWDKKVGRKSCQGFG